MTEVILLLAEWAYRRRRRAVVDAQQDRAVVQGKSRQGGG
jgi:hypothetical protein